MSFLHYLRRSARKFGIEVARFPTGYPPYESVRLLKKHGIDTVIDIGASDGRYGAELREFGYPGTIVSFEPLSNAYTLLEARARFDPLWKVERVALGASRGDVILNVSGSNNGASSSIRKMLPLHQQAAPGSAFVGSEVVPQITLDEIWPRVAASSKRAFIKVDVQGYEDEVLAGGQSSLTRCAGICLELSLVPLYDGALLMESAVESLRASGFTLMRLDPGFSDPRTGQMLQVDATFFR